MRDLELREEVLKELSERHGCAVAEGFPLLPRAGVMYINPRAIDSLVAKKKERREREEESWWMT